MSDLFFFFYLFFFFWGPEMKQWLFLVLLVSFTISAMGWVLFRFFVHYNHSVCNFGYEGSMLVGQVWSGFLFFHRHSGRKIQNAALLFNDAQRQESFR